MMNNQSLANKRSVIRVISYWLFAIENSPDLQIKIMNTNGKSETAQKPVLPGRAVRPPLDAGKNDPQKRLDLFTPERPTYTLDQLVLAPETRTQLESLLTKIKYQTVLYDEFGLREVDPHGGRTAINFYGPPGTGKSMAAEAIAHHLGMEIIRANYAEIESKFVGETAKNIRAAFQKGQETGALLFFDEADSILGRRLTNVRQSTDHAVNVSRSVMLLSLDNFSGVTVFATNLASNYDSAFVRRILGHIEMRLPDTALRLQLWQTKIPKKLPLAADVDLALLAERSDGLSGGEILNVVINAASFALQREGRACRVAFGDFDKAIAQIRDAKAVVGRE